MAICWKNAAREAALRAIGDAGGEASGTTDHGGATYLRSLRQALERGPVVPEGQVANAHYSFARDFESRGLHAETLRYLERAVSAEPARAPSGRRLMAEAKAALAFSKLAEPFAYGVSYRALDAPARAQSKLGNADAWFDPEEGKRLAEDGLRLDSDSPRCLHALGLALYKLGQFEDALPILERASYARADRFLFWTYLTMADALWRSGRRDEAVVTWRQSLIECGKQPEYTEIQRSQLSRNLDWIQSGIPPRTEPVAAELKWRPPAER
jgi:tetratricopeptide (TPR) repeat protein